MAKMHPSENQNVIWNFAVIKIAFAKPYQECKIELFAKILNG